MPKPQHVISIVPAPKMDAPSLVAAECSCGEYRSSPTTENDARTRGEHHRRDKAAVGK